MLALPMKVKVVSNFSKLKKGDEVLVKNAVNYRKVTVEAVTDKYIIIHGKEYKKENGVHKRGLWFGQLVIPSKNKIVDIKRDSDIFYD
jgi:hypothetical protein